MTLLKYKVSAKLVLSNIVLILFSCFLMNIANAQNETSIEGEANKYIKKVNQHFDKGDYEKGIPFLLKAIGIYEEANISEGSQIANYYHGLANAYRFTNQYKKAEEYYLKAISAEISAMKLDHPELLFYYGDLGVLYFTLNRYDEAETYLLKSLTAKYDSAGHKRKNLDFEYLSSMYKKVGDIYLLHKGRHKDALENYRMAIEILSKVNKKDEFENMLLQHMYALALDINGMSKQAIFQYEEVVIPMQKKFWKEDEANLADSYTSLARLFNFEKEYDKAETWNLKALNILEKNFGRDDPRLVTVYGQLGVVCYNLNLFTKAEIYLNYAIKLQKQKTPISHQRLLKWSYFLARTYMKIGSVAKAQELLESEVTLRGKELGALHHELILPYLLLGHVYMHKTSYADAELFYLKAVKNSYHNYTNADELSKVAVAAYIESLEAQNKPTKNAKMKYGVLESQIVD